MTRLFFALLLLLAGAGAFASYLPQPSVPVSGLSAATTCSGTDVVVLSQDGGATLVQTPLSALSLCGGAPAAPGTVTSLAAGTIASTTVQLTWAAGSGGAATSWTVTKRSPSGSGTYAAAAGTFTGTGGTVTGLTASTSYDFQVVATNVTGSSTAATLTNTTTTAAPAAPGTVVSLAAGTITSNSIVLTWAAGSGGAATSWTVTQRTPTGSGSYVASAGTFTGGTVTGLSAASSYDFQVVATNVTGSSTAATLTNTTTSAAAPGSVVSLAAGTPTSTTVPLTWAAGSGGTATSWTVTQRTPSGSGSYVASAGTFTGAGGTVTGLAVSSSYDFQVVATNASGSSAATTLTGVTTAAGASYVGLGDVQTLTYYYGFRAVTGAKASAGVALFRLCDHLFANCADVVSGSNGYPTGTLTRGSDNCAALTTCQISAIYEQVSGTGPWNWNATGFGPTYNPTAGGSHACGIVNALSLTPITGATAYAQPYSIAAVYKASSGSTLFGANGTMLLTRSGANDMELFAGTALHATVADGVMHDIVAVANGASSAIHVNGVTGTPGNAGSAALTTSWYFLGDWGGGGFNGNTVCEVGIVNAAISGSTAASMHTNQEAAWGSY